MNRVALLVLLLPLSAASAATITVNSTADDYRDGDGRCTLREAIVNVDDANDTSGGDCAAGTGSGDTIVFQLDHLPATIRLHGHDWGELDITRDVVIVGPTTGSLRIDARQKTRVLEVYAGTTTISNLTFQNGHVSDWGGGVQVDIGATLNLDNCTLRGNRTGNKGGGGGAIFAYSGATVNLTNCTLTKNKTGSGGGAILNDGLATVTLTNCTISDNKAHGTQAPWRGGGGILNRGSATLINTIVSGSGKGQNCAGDQPITSAGHNLSSDSTCFASGGSDLLDTNPRLTRLADNGGPTHTMALCSALHVPRPMCHGASAAIDAGDDSVTGPPDNLATDQRGLPRSAGAHVDIGAYESQ